MTEQPKMRIIKKDDKSKSDEYIARHKDSLLRLLIEENPERAQMIIDKLRQSMKAAA